MHGCSDAWVQRCMGAWEHADTAEVQVNLIIITRFRSIRFIGPRKPIKLNIQVEVHNVHQMLIGLIWFVILPDCCHWNLTTAAWMDSAT